MINLKKQHEEVYGVSERFLYVGSDFRSLFPAARIGVVAARDFSNRRDDSGDALLEEAGRKALERLGESAIAEHPDLACWRRAYRTFGAPKGYRSSIESLVKRVASGKPLPSINPLVDLYNAVSLEFFFPAGGEDLDAVVGDLRLVLADGGEPFVPLGRAESDPPRRGEAIYRDDEGVVCRCWNWREAQRTCLTESTSRALLVLESLDPLRDEELASALLRLADGITARMGGTTDIHVLDGDAEFLVIP